jgi:hypothetical protein
MANESSPDDDIKSASLLQIGLPGFLPGWTAPTTRRRLAQVQPDIFSSSHVRHLALSGPAPSCPHHRKPVEA